MAKRLSAEERRWRALESTHVERIAELDAAGRTVYTSPNHAEEAEGALATLERVVPEDREAVSLEFIAAFRDGAPRRTSFRVVDPDGTRRWVEVTITPFEAEDGRHVLVLSRDVTEARENEQRLRESRQRFQLIAENAYDMIAEYDSHAELLYVNDRVRQVLGYSDAERAFGSEIVHPDDIEGLALAFGPVHDGSRESAQHLYRVRRADDTWCWIDGSARSARRADGERHLVIIARDVTERVEAEQRTRESEQRYRELVESAPLGIVVVQDDRVVYANQAAATIAGVEDSEALAGLDLLQFLEGDSRSQVLATLERGRGGMSIPKTLDLVVRRVDGERRSLHCTIDLIRYDGAPAYQGIIRDVTELERSRRARRRLELQLQESRKLESLGVLAGGIAHDFNNLLAVILSSVRYAGANEDLPEDCGEALRDAEEATEQAARLVAQLLAYAGRRSPEVRSVDLTNLARSLSELLGSALRGSVDLRLELDPEPLFVYADLVQLEQVLMNLVLNAAEAVGEGPGTVTVRSSRRDFAASELCGWLGGRDLPGGQYACLEVEDSGVGMSDETRARIFEPFFSTKVDGHGLGLSAALGLVQGHRGAIDVRSELGSGTRFRIALPVDDAGVRVEPTRGRPLLLVADADAPRRRLAAEALRAAGCEVLEAGDATQAREVWNLHGEELDAAVLDGRLAAGEAPSLDRAFRSVRPGLPLLLLAAEGGAVEPGGTGPSATLRCPFSRQELCEGVLALLGKAAPDA